MRTSGRIAHAAVACIVFVGNTLIADAAIPGMTDGRATTPGVTHGGVRTAPTDHVYEAECGSCHLAYPPSLLASTEWTRVLGRLEQHFGVDASLDPATLAVVAQHLGTRVENSAVTARSASVSTTGSTADGSLPRITAKAWFRDEHDELSPAAFRSPEIRSRANCSACHSGAERGDFDEHTLRFRGNHGHDD